MINPKLVALSVSVLAAASLAACDKPAPAAPVVDTAKIADAVKATQNDMMAGFNAHDVAKAVSHDAPDMVGMFHGAPNIVGPDQDTAMTKSQLASAPDAKVEISNETVDVAASGDMAVYHASYAYSGTDAKTKKVNTEKGNMVVGYKKVGDAWKIAWNVVSDIGTGNGIPTATVVAK